MIDSFRLDIAIASDELASLYILVEYKNDPLFKDPDLSLFIYFTKVERFWDATHSQGICQSVSLLKILRLS